MMLHEKPESTRAGAAATRPPPRTGNLRKRRQSNLRAAPAREENQQATRTKCDTNPSG